jgi:hypothetical protein
VAFFLALLRSREETKRRSDCMQRWIGFSKDDGSGFAEAENIRRQSRIYSHRVEDNAIYLARKLRAFTVRRDGSAR